jgi:hypothetical protein
LVSKAPKEKPAPWPHIDAENANVIKLWEDDRTEDIWRTKRHLSKYPKREPGSIQSGSREPICTRSVCQHAGKEVTGNVMLIVCSRSFENAVALGLR